MKPLYWCGSPSSAIGEKVGNTGLFFGDTVVFSAVLRKERTCVGWNKEKMCPYRVFCAWRRCRVAWTCSVKGTTDLTEMRKTRKYAKLKNRGGGDVEKAKRHEGTRKTKWKKRIRRWLRCLYRHNRPFFERDGFQTTRGLLEIYRVFMHDTLYNLSPPISKVM